jgi:dienelactone hydrolase
MNRIVRSLPFLSILIACGSVYAEPPFEKVALGIERALIETKSGPDAPPMNVWVYRPLGSRAKSLPCVLIAASGSNGLNGAALNDDLVPEHVPFVSQGFSVIAFDVDGAITTQTDPSQYQAMLSAFMQAEGGLANAREALRVASEVEPRIDTSRMFAAGHGSAANVAMFWAANDERVKAVVAFSPLDDAVARTGNASIDAINTALPGYRAFLERSQPLALAEKIKARVMLFHPADDGVTPIAATRALAEKLKAAGNEAEVTEPREGGHVEAMMSSGLENAAKWFAEMAKRMPATKPVEVTRP